MGLVLFITGLVMMVIHNLIIDMYNPSPEQLNYIDVILTVGMMLMVYGAGTHFFQGNV